MNYKYKYLKYKSKYFELIGGNKYYRRIEKEIDSLKKKRNNKFNNYGVKRYYFNI